MRGALISTTPVAVAYLIPAVAPTPWQAFNPSTGAFDPLAPSAPTRAVSSVVLDKAHLVPLNRGPAGTLGNVWWFDVPDAACLPGVLAVPVPVDGTGSPGPGPAALDVEAVDPGVRVVRLSMAPS